MAKNITVGISDELSKRMDELTEVNWSAVTRECIEQYIKQRTAGDLEQIIAKIKQKRSDDFKNGYKFLLKNIEPIDLASLEELAHLDQDDEPLYNAISQHIKELIYELEPQALGIKISSDFIKGMQEAAKEILEKSK